MIVFAHFGNSWYLDSVFKVARRFNPDEQIILLGDKQNLSIAEKHGLEWSPYEHFGGGLNFRYKKEFEWIKNNYEQIGTAPQWAHQKHKFNFLRWFRLLNFLESYDISDCWYFDTDTLLCRNLQAIDRLYRKHLMYVINGISGCAVKINNLEPLRRLCELIFCLRRDPKFIECQMLLIDEKRAEGKHYNFCDMTVIRELRRHFNLGELSNIEYESDGLGVHLFDSNVNCGTSEHVPDYPYRFVMNGCHKKITWYDHGQRNVPHIMDIDSRKVFRLNSINTSWVEKGVFNFWARKLLGE